MVKEIAGFIVAPMWNTFMQFALDKAPKEYFNEPPAIPQGISPALRGVSSIPLPGGGFTAHSILYWVNKNNPQGPPPSNPASDPQYAYWEYPVQVWLGNSLQQQPPVTSTTTTATSTGQ